MLGSFSIIWRRIYGWSRISACWYWPMPICTQRRAGLSFLEWPSRAGESASKATRGIIQTSGRRLCANLPRRSLGRYNIVLWRPPATSCRTSCPYAIVKRTNALWTAPASLRRQTKSLLLYALSASGRWAHIWVSMDRSSNCSRSWEMYSNLWTITIHSRASGVSWGCLTEWFLVCRSCMSNRDWAVEVISRMPKVATSSCRG